MTTTESHIRVFESTLQITHNWLRELELLADLRDQGQAYSVLRAVLHALRDRLTPDEAVNLGAQMPMLVRGFYYENWKPSATPRKQRTLESFLEAIPILLNPRDAIEVKKAVECVFKVLDHRISEGEINDVRHMLPKEVRALWPRH